MKLSVRVQDEERMRVAAVGAGKSAVVVGGAGRMGRWLCRFLSAQGFDTGALDPAGNPEENEWAKRTLPTADLVVCSTPPAATAALYAEWSKKPLAGVVVDIASIKTPLVQSFLAKHRRIHMHYTPTHSSWLN